MKIKDLTGRAGASYPHGDAAASLLYGRVLTVLGVDVPVASDPLEVEGIWLGVAADGTTLLAARKKGALLKAKALADLTGFSDKDAAVVGSPQDLAAALSKWSLG